MAGSPDPVRVLEKGLRKATQDEGRGFRHVDVRDRPASQYRTAHSVTYGSYLKVHELLALQQPLTKPEQHDETLFIVIHQVYELWFKQLLHEVDRADAAMDADQLMVFQRIAKRMISSA